MYTNRDIESFQDGMHIKNRVKQTCTSVHAHKRLGINRASAFCEGNYSTVDYRTCGCCQETERKTEEFKKVLDLKASGLSIYIHKHANNMGEWRRSSVNQDETFILHNPNEKTIKRYDYIRELGQIKTKCCQCKLLIQRIRSAMGEISDINASEIRGLCPHCMRANPTGKCKRCEFIANRFFCHKVKHFEERQMKIELWLCKVRALLQAILERNIFSLSIDEIDMLLKELDTTLSMYETEIDEIESSRKHRRETKDLSENFLTKLRTQKGYSSNESIYASSSRAGTTNDYKYLMGITKSEEALKTNKDFNYKRQSDIEDYGANRTKKITKGGVKRESSIDELLSAKFKSVASTKYHSDTISLKGEIGHKKVYSAENIPSSTTRSKFYPKSSNKEKASLHTEYDKKREDTKESSGKLLSSTEKSKSKKGTVSDTLGKSHTEEPLSTKLKTPVGTTRKPDVKMSSNREVGSKGMTSSEVGPSSKSYPKTSKKADEEKKSKEDKDNSSKLLSSTMKSKPEKSAVMQAKNEPCIDDKSRSGPSGKSNLKTSKNVLNKEQTKGVADDEKRQKSTKDSSSKLLSSTMKSKPEKGAKNEPRIDDISRSGPFGKSQPKTSKNISNKEQTDDDEEKKQKGTKDSASKSKKGTVLEDSDIPSGKSYPNTSKNISNKEKNSANTDDEKKKKGTKDSTSNLLSGNMKSTSKKGADKGAKNDDSTEKPAKDGNEIKAKRKSTEDAKNNINQKKGKSEVDDALNMLVMMDKKKKEKQENVSGRQNKMNLAKVLLPKIDDLPLPKPIEIIEIKKSSESFIELGNEHRPVRPTNMIKNMDIVPFDPHYKDEKKLQVEPLLFKIDPSYCYPTITEVASDSVPASDLKGSSKNKFNPRTSFGKGVLKYELSNQEFINKGWTQLPTTKVMKRMNIYKMIPANLNNDWFSRHSDKEILLYNTGEKLAEVKNCTTGSWYYKNGPIALDYYPAEEVNAGQRVVIYSNSCKEDGDVEKALPVTVLASFDSLGNGVVYDHFGNIRLKYNQSEGIIIDSKIGPPGLWKWHMLNDPPDLQPVFIDTYSKDRDPRLEEILSSQKDNKKDDNSGSKKQFIEKDQEMIAIELENFVKEKANKILQGFKPFQIRMKALKINNQFSLKILDQANIYLLFCDGSITMKLDLGMVLKSNEIIDSDTAEISQIATPYDKHPPKSRSMANIQDILRKARKLGKVKSVVSKSIISTT